MLLKNRGMGSEEGGEEMGRRTVVVGMRMDPESRELLTWSLVKVAQQKDRVFALHVLPNASRFDRSNASDVALLKAFDSELAVYEGLCSLKQIDLQLKICRASSLRKALVRETSGLGATRLVLGVAKNSYSIGSSPTSIAKYCAKKLSRDCWVLAVNSGKIIFEKPPSVSENSLALVCRSSYLLEESNGNSFCLLPSHKYQKSISGVERSRLSRPSSEKNCSPRLIDCSQTEMPLALVPVPSNESRAVSVLVREEAKPGWPLLRRVIMQRKKAASEKSKISVVQWTMQLPPRYQAPSSTDSPNQKISKEDSNSECGLSGESCSIVHTGTVSGNLDAVEDENMGSLPKELESLHDKCAASCRLFTYQELASATSDFSPGEMHVEDSQEMAHIVINEECVILDYHCTDQVLGVETTTNEVGESVEKPFIGMKFCSDEDLVAFYNSYARTVGFSIRKHKMRRSERTNLPIARKVVCSKQGLKDLKDKREEGREVKRRRDIREGCQAHIYASVDDEGTWVVRTFQETHNHVMTSPSKVEKLRSHKEISSCARGLIDTLHCCGLGASKISSVLSSSGEKNITSQVCIDQIKVSRKNNLGHESMAVVRCFEDKMTTDNEFFFKVELDENMTMRSVFWADGRSRASYLHFGDVLVFDTTYRTNKFMMPFAPFTGVNHHKQSTLFGCALLADEMTETFIWLFRTWLQCMHGKLPIAIITDQDPAMREAIAMVFPTTTQILHLAYQKECINSFASIEM